MRRLGFLGAMNRDVVVQGDGATILDALGIRAVPLVETAIADAVAQSAVEQLGRLGAREYLGGSAFNAARVTSLLNQDKALDLAFYGVAGSLSGVAPHRAALENWGMDASGVTTVSEPPATCLSIADNSGRTLLTASGANAAAVDWLRTGLDRLATALAGCDIVHITSYLDPDSPAVVAELLARARRRNPGLVVSLDPGMAWIGTGGGGLDALLAQTQILHLNAEECSTLCGSSPPGSMGARLGQGWMIVTRTHHGATVHSAGHTGPTEQNLPEHFLPDAGRVVDATGAGDTFCGGFLWSYCRAPGAPLAAAALGFRLAQLKIAMRGPLVINESVMSVLKEHRERAERTEECAGGYQR